MAVSSATEETVRTLVQPPNPFLARVQLPEQDMRIPLASECKVGAYRKGSAFNQKLCGYRQSQVQVKLVPLDVILKGVPEPCPRRQPGWEVALVSVASGSWVTEHRLPGEGRSLS